MNEEEEKRVEGVCAVGVKEVPSEDSSWSALGNTSQVPRVSAKAFFGSQSSKCYVCLGD